MLSSSEMRICIKKSSDVSKRECDGESLVHLESVVHQVCHASDKNIFEAPPYYLFKSPI